MSNEYKNVLKYQNTKANLESNNSIINGSWAYVTDYNQIGIKQGKTDWRYVGGSALWDYDSILNNIETVNNGDILEIPSKFGINSLSDSDYNFGLGVDYKMQIYSTSEETGIAFGAYENAGSWYNEQTTEMAGKMSFGDGNITLKLSDNIIENSLIDFEDYYYNFGRRSFDVDGISTFTYRDGSSNIISSELNYVALNNNITERTKFDLGFGTDNYIIFNRIIKVDIQNISIDMYMSDILQVKISGGGNPPDTSRDIGIWQFR